MERANFLFGREINLCTEVENGSKGRGTLFPGKTSFLLNKPELSEQSSIDLYHAMLKQKILPV